MMKAETISTIKATAPVLKEHGQAITQRMYEIAFDARPDARQLFATTWMVSSEEGRKQAGRLAGAVYAYAEHIDDLEKLAGGSGAYRAAARRHEGPAGNLSGHWSVSHGRYQGCAKRCCHAGNPRRLARGI